MTRSARIALLAALLIALLVALPAMAEPGLLNTRGGGDSPFLLQRLHQFTVALADGHFPVRWMPDANYGYGYPFFNFYAPLSIYIAAFFRFFGFSFVRAIQLAQLGGFLVAASGAYALGRRWLGNPRAGLLTSAAYTLAPFHMVNVYIRGDSLAEFWAMAFYPLILLAADRLLTHPSRSNAVWLAASYAALILTHNISALIFTPFLLFYLVIRYPLSVIRKPNMDTPTEADVHGSRITDYVSRFTPLSLSLLSILLALALSAWFFLPALAERSLAQLGPVTEGYFHYSNHFRGLDLVQPSLLFDYDVAAGRAFRMGPVQSVLAAAGSIVLLTSYVSRFTFHAPPRHPVTLSPCHPFILLTLLLTTFMITPLSRPLWDTLPLLPYVQFPWRFLSVQALATALATGALAMFHVSYFTLRPFLVAALILLLLVAGLGRLRTDHLLLTDHDVTAERLAEYEWFTGNIGTTVSAEYLPPAVNPRPFTSGWLETGERASLRALDGTITSAELLDWRATTRRWHITSGEEGATILFPTLYWPGWKATVDGQPTPITPAPGSGLITLALPAGAHSVTLSLGRTPIRLGAELISLAGLAIALALLASSTWRGQRPATARMVELARHLVTPSPGHLVTLALILLALGLYLWPERPLPEQDLTQDFAQMGYLHHSEVITFADGVQLLGYEYSQETVGPGDTLDVTLTWQAPVAGEAVLDLVTPATNRYDVTPSFASASQTIQNGRVTYRLQIPENAPRGLVQPRLRRPAPAVTPSGQPRGDLFLRPIRITNFQSPISNPQSALTVQPITVTQTSSDDLLVQLQWLTAQPLAANYAVSLRLSDATGAPLACSGSRTGFCQLDVQPGYGYQPSSLWPPGQWVDDWLSLPLPSVRALLVGAPYALTAHLYDPATGEAVLIHRLGELVPAGDSGEFTFRPTEPVFTLPRAATPVEIAFFPVGASLAGAPGRAVIALRGYEGPGLDEAAQQLDLTLYWQATGAARDDYTHFVHLIDPQTGAVVAQHDAMPRNNSYPTSQWAEGEIVGDPVTLDLRDVPGGDYRLAIGLYQNRGDGDLPRLPATDAQGRPLPENRFLLPQRVAIP